MRTTFFSFLLHSLLCGKPKVNSSVDSSELPPDAKDLIRDKLQEYFGRKVKISLNRYPRGVASFFIGKVEATMSLACKVDYKDSFLDKLKRFQDLPDGIKALFPETIAATVDKPPYISIDEHLETYANFHDLIFAKDIQKEQIERLTAQIMKVLLGAYNATLDDCCKPNLTTLYINRITERLEEAKRRDKRFGMLQSRKVVIDGDTLDRPSDYIEAISSDINKLEPSFATFIHGDAHPDNVLVKRKDSEFDIKLVDKDNVRIRGDYLYDIGKMTHWLKVFWLIRNLKDASKTLDLKIDFNDPIEIKYALKPSENSTLALKVVLDQTEKFARKYKDDSWESRLLLSEASALLGCPMRIMDRWKDFECAVLTFAEGLKKLNETKNAMLAE